MRGDRNLETGRLLIAAFVIVLIANVVVAVWGLFPQDLALTRTAFASSMSRGCSQRLASPFILRLDDRRTDGSPNHPYSTKRHGWRLDLERREGPDQPWIMDTKGEETGQDVDALRRLAAEKGWTLIDDEEDHTGRNADR